MVTFGVTFVTCLRKAKARTTELGRQRIGPTTLRSEKPCVGPEASRHLSLADPVRSASKPCQPRISSSHQLRRRNSPSVTAWRPMRSCIATTSRMHSPSTAQVGVAMRADRAGRRLRTEELFARLLEPLGTQEAADLVGSKGRFHENRKWGQSNFRVTTDERSCYK